MSSSDDRTLVMIAWAIDYAPPMGGFVTWGRLSKTPQEYALPFPLFQSKEEADAALAESKIDKAQHRVVQVKLTITEI